MGILPIRGVSPFLYSLEEIRMNNVIKKAIMPIPSSIPNTEVREVYIGGRTILSLRAKWGPLFEGQQRAQAQG